MERDALLAANAAYYRAFRMGDFPAWSALRHASQGFLQPWEPTWPSDDLTRAAFRRRLALYQRDQDLGQGHAFFVFRTSDNVLVGAHSRSSAGFLSSALRLPSVSAEERRLFYVALTRARFQAGEIRGEAPPTATSAIRLTA